MTKKKANKTVNKFDKDILLTILGVVAVVAIAVLVVLFTSAMTGHASSDPTVQSTSWRLGQDVEQSFANRGTTARDEIEATKG